MKRKLNKKKIFVAMALVLALILLVVFAVQMLRPNEIISKKQAANSSLDALTSGWQNREQLRLENKEKIADYQSVLQTVNRRDRSFLSAEEEAQFIALNAEISTNLTEEFDMERAEEQINQMVYILDRHDIASGDGVLTYRRGILMANKEYCMPADFAPGVSPQATQAMAEMAAAAAADGIHIEAFSTYRSYDAQVSIFNRYVANDGEEAANRYSSKPGCSDHQTGMAFDIGSYDQSQWAETTFDGTPAALWLEEHAPEYGFILRYPQGKEDITGYIYESWHFRYVGDIAPRITASGKTVEEYFELI